MTRDERLNSILAQFDKCANEFCRRTGGIFCDISNDYGNTSGQIDLKKRLAKIYYNSFAVEFKYTAHGMMNIVNSILECIVYLDKSDFAIGIPLPLLTDYCDIDIVTPLCIPCIFDADGMRQAFNCITEVLAKLKQSIAEVAGNEEQKENLLSFFYWDLRQVFYPDNISSGISLEFCYSLLTDRFSSSAFILFIKGDRKGAVKELRKCKKLLGYEKRMIRLWQSPENISLPDIHSVVSNLNMYNRKGVPKTNFKEFFAFFFLLLFFPYLYLPFTLPFFSPQYCLKNAALFILSELPIICRTAYSSLLLQA